jgi:hypothetical protein
LHEHDAELRRELSMALECFGIGLDSRSSISMPWELSMRRADPHRIGKLRGRIYPLRIEHHNDQHEHEHDNDDHWRAWGLLCGHRRQSEGMR